MNTQDLSDKQEGHCWRPSTDFHYLCNFFHRNARISIILDHHFFYIAKSLTIFSTILLCAFRFPFYLPPHENKLNPATERDLSFFNDCAHRYRIYLNDIFCSYTRAGTTRRLLPVPCIFWNFKSCW